MMVLAGTGVGTVHEKKECGSRSLRSPFLPLPYPVPRASWKSVLKGMAPRNTVNQIPKAHGKESKGHQPKQRGTTPAEKATHIKGRHQLWVNI